MARNVRTPPYWLRWMTSIFHSSPRNMRTIAWACAIFLVFILSGVNRIISPGDIEHGTVYSDIRGQGSPLTLESTLQTTWSHHTNRSWHLINSSSGTVDANQWWQGLVSPRVPPFVCQIPGDPPGPPSLYAMARAWYALEQQRASGVLARDAEERFSESVDRFLRDSSLPNDSYIRAYNLGLAMHLTGSSAVASRALGEIGQASPEFLPSLPRAEARAWAARHRISADEVRKAILSRYLLGVIQFDRNGGELDAITNFRLGISGFNYLIPSDLDIGPAAGIELFSQDDWSCGTGMSESQHLTSIDVYQGLVAAYLLSPEELARAWTNRSSEFARPDGSMDSSDLLAPFVRLGQRGGPRSSSGPIPENVLWAASNLQRLRGLNASSEIPRLEPLALVLGLVTLAHSDWMGAYLSEAQGDPCSFATRLLEEVEWRRHFGIFGVPYGTSKGRLATLVSYLDGAYQATCNLGSALSQDEQSLALQLSRMYAFDPYPGVLETRRLQLLTTTGGGSVAEAIWDSISLEERLIRRQEPLVHLGSPSAGLHAGSLASNWRSSVFRDLALSTARFIGDERGPGFDDREVVLALFDAAHIAGLRPSDLFQGQGVDFSLSDMGAGARSHINLKYHYSNAPLVGRFLMLLVFVLSLSLACFLLLIKWRYSLLAGTMYAREKTYRIKPVPVTQTINEQWLEAPGPRG